MVGVNKNGCGRATPPDFLQHLAVGHLRESMSAIFLRRGHPEHADPTQAVNHAARNISLPIDFRSIEIFIQKFTKFSNGWIQRAPFGLGDTRVWHHPIRHEMPLEKSFREPQCLGPGEEQFFSLLNLFLSLLVEFVHSIEKRETNSSSARSHVLLGASQSRSPNALGL